ncbi:MAG: hypothetical protein DRI44_03835 [Chlamydiae bacterium]|nr:MAG: hypothetical protein DRI44_03835 [Chlamydiota bacterium]
MKISPSLIGKIFGAIAVIAICISLFLLSKANYSIKGHIQVDTGTYINPARNVDVKLILGSVEDQLNMLVKEYESYRDFRKEKTIEAIFEQMNPKTTNSSQNAQAARSKETITSVLSSITGTSLETGATGKIKINLSKLDDKEREQVTTLVSKYYQNSTYCRDQAIECPIGAIFYEKGSFFWESKADNLVKNKRIVFDEITTNYITTWVDGGLGHEPIQVVKAVVVTNLTLREIKAALGETNDEEVVVKKEKEIDTSVILSNFNISTNDVIKAVIDLRKDLQQKYQAILSKSDNLLIEMILDQVTTDENGNYIFKGKTIKPGKYFVSSQYDILSSEGERVEFSWFNPIAISLKRLAFNKSSIINLDELNQSKPPVNDIYIPETNELVLDILDGLNNKINEVKAEESSSTNITQTLAVTEIIVSGDVNKNEEISSSNSVPEINIVKTLTTNDVEATNKTLKSTN